MNPAVKRRRRNLVDVDGRFDSKGVQFIGYARRQTDGSYICLADVGGALCRVAVNITWGRR